MQTELHRIGAPRSADLVDLYECVLKREAGPRVRGREQCQRALACERAQTAGMRKRIQRPRLVQA